MEDELKDWAEMARLARTSWTKDNPWEEDESSNNLSDQAHMDSIREDEC